ncbi:oligosaccharide flippase family protein [Psychrobacillus sp. FJAT-51614]|uniref:Oligosaccharide flippase family protein n=1 Tax=Psychrobacillus mangrovi TaxID=3117745 RepID=A0ABU8F6A0_9BACI
MSNKFIKSLSVLMMGSAFSNVLIVITTPILTRLYTPEEFGHLSVFLSVLFTLSIIASLRLETAIPLPKKDKDAHQLAILSIAVVVIISTLTFIVTLLIPFQEKYIFLVSFSLFGIGLYQVFNAWAIRVESFGVISKAKIAMNGGQLSVQLLLGVFQFGLIGLLVGEVVGRIAGSISYMKQFKIHFPTRQVVNLPLMKQVTSRYKSFPLLSNWAALINSFGSQLPTFFLAFHFDPTTAGLVFLAQRIGNIPEGLIGFSASQVYISQAAIYARTSIKEIESFFWEIVKKMLIMGAFAMIAASITIPFVIELVFGEVWKDSGVYLQILAILYLMKIIINPISGNFIIFEALTFQIISECIRLLFIGGSILIAYFYFSSPYAAMICITLISSLGYFIHGFFAWFVMKRRLANI